ncbi:hypothetical protein L3Q67_45385 (plasmid) [Saccharothrix sp. AJ9571]|nr:hypothetical protein L3Q67_45385 [Saccharothrix sp. AJ9571]
MIDENGVVDPAVLFAEFQAGNVTPGQMVVALPGAWRYRPDQDPLNSTEAWRSMFLHAGYFEWTSGMSGVRRTRKPLLVRRLYRGATAERRFGLSWTTNPSIARHFAVHRQPPGETGQIWVATFRRVQLLAYFRGEREYLVDADGADVQPYPDRRRG